MNTAELSKKFSEMTGYTLENSKQIVGDLLIIASSVIETGEPLYLAGLGNFKTVKSKGRPTMNINTGEKIAPVPCNKIKFSPSRKLKERVMHNGL